MACRESRLRYTPSSFGFCGCAAMACRESRLRYTLHFATSRVRSLWPAENHGFDTLPCRSSMATSWLWPAENHGFDTLRAAPQRDVHVLWPAENHGFDTLRRGCDRTHFGLWPAENHGFDTLGGGQPAHRGEVGRLTAFRKARTGQGDLPPVCAFSQSRPPSCRTGGR